MFIRWLLVLAFSFQITSSIAADDYRDWTPEKAKQVASRWNAQFDSVKKQIALTEKIASGKMDTMISQIDGEHVVTNRIRDSIADPDTGKKIKIEANVTQKADKTKVASTLTDRLKKAKDYAAKTGKASIPAFVGMAAFNGLMQGIDWVMDEGGNIVRPTDPDAPDPASLPCSASNNNCDWSPSLYYSGNYPQAGSFSNKDAAIQAVARKRYSNVVSCTNITWGGQYGSIAYCILTQTNSQGETVTHSSPSIIGAISSKTNPNYLAGSTPPEHTPVSVSDQEIENAVKNALESNNPALAAAIAEAIKAAYTPESPAIAPISDAQSNGLAESATDSARDAVNRAANNDGTDPSSHGKPGYYKITDGDKTIEGYVYPSDTTSTGLTDSTTVTNPDGSTTTTGTTSSMWPNFCDWAGVVCEFIDWVKEDEYIPDDEQPEIDESIFDREFDIELFAVADCPPNPVWNFTFINSEWSKEIDITMICDFFRWLGFGINIAAGMTAMWIVYSAVVVRDQA